MRFYRSLVRAGKDGQNGTEAFGPYGYGSKPKVPFQGLAAV